MRNDQRVLRRSRWALAVLTGFVLALGLLVSPGTAAAAVNCSSASTATDSDRDGLSDAHECAGITTAGTTPKSFPRCVADANGVIAARENCVDPDSKDVFVIYAPKSTGSLLSALPNPFALLDFSCTRTDGTSWCGTAGIISLRGLSALGLTVHQLTVTQAASDRKVTSVSTQKAVRVTESLDVSTADILGNCQWGVPTGLDGCVIYTQRAMNFINTKCNLAGDNTTDRNQVFLAYAAFLAIHEVGHSIGGLAPNYNSTFGGYHYATTSGFVMSQSAQYSTQGARCSWYIPSTWNPTVDPAGVKLK